MSEWNAITEQLDRLITAVDEQSAPTHSAGAGDAIDREIGRKPRITNVGSLRDAPEVQAFREALIDGFIRVDTANQLLRLLNTIITQWPR